MSESSRKSLCNGLTATMAIATTYWGFHFINALSIGKGMFNTGVMGNPFWISYPLVSLAVGIIVRYCCRKCRKEMRWSVFINSLVAVSPLIWIVIAPMVASLDWKS
jgi:hypothetical protein